MKKTAVVLIIVMLLTLTASCKRQVAEDETATILPSTETVEQVTSDTPSDVSENKSPETAEHENTETVDTSDKVETTVEEKIVTNSPVKENTTENSEEKVPQTTPENESQTNDDESDGYLIETTADVIPSPMEKMIAKSKLIAVCEYIGPTEYIYTEPGWIQTEHSMRVIEVLRGTADKSEITVRVEGGSIDGETLINRSAPKFLKDNIYLMFLYNPGAEMRTNTEGDHYFIVNEENGAMKVSTEQEIIPDLYKLNFEVPDDDTVFVPMKTSFHSSYGLTLITEETLATPSSGAAIILGDFRELLKKLNKSIPVNENYAREENLALYKEQLDAGRITEAEYVERTKEKTEYAKVVKRVKVKDTAY